MNAYPTAEMQREDVRLASFLEFPDDVPVIPSILGRAGFYYKRRANAPVDEVTCYSCGCKVSGWELLNDAYERHRDANPNCSVLNGGGEDNVPFGPSQTLERQQHEELVEPDGGDVVEAVSSLGPGNYGMTVTQMQRQPTGTVSENVVTSLPLSSSFATNTDLPPIATSRRGLGLAGGSISTRPHHGRTNSLVHAMTEQDRRRELKRERMRLATFTDWPDNAAVTKEAVAKAGFYHIGPGDRVRCAFCYNVLRMWERGDIPEREHKQYFPRCPLLVGPDTCGNIPAELDGEPLWSRPTDVANSSPIDTRPTPPGTLPTNPSAGLGIVMSRPSDTRYVLESTRLRTFDTWPPYAALSPECLAEAGFYYLGVTDTTRCFFCEVLLKLWKASDDPWEEHARWQPTCGFLLMKKGESFTEEVTRKYATAQAVVSATQNITAGMVSDPLVDRRTLFETMRSQMVQEAVQMGFRRETVSRVVEQRLIARGGPYPNLQSLIVDLRAADREGPVASRATEASPRVRQERSYDDDDDDQTTEREVTEHLPADTDAVSEVSGAGGVTEAGASRVSDGVQEDHEEEVDPDHLLTENRKLKEAQVCKVCMEREVSIVFLPCAHLVCCGNCAASVTHCPICRALIKGTVKTYKS